MGLHAALRPGLSPRSRIESFIQSSRIVLGSFVAGTLRGLAGTFKLLGSFLEALTLMLIHVYDFVIIVPLRLEQVLQKKNGVGTAVADHAATEGGLGR